PVAAQGLRQPMRHNRDLSKKDHPMSSRLALTKPSFSAANKVSWRAGRLAGLTLAAFTLSAVSALAQAAPAAMADQAPRVISVIGRGAVEQAPDMASVSVGVTATGDTAAAALSANSSALNAVLERLKADGVQEGD